MISFLLPAPSSHLGLTEASFLPNSQLFVRAILYKLFLFNIIPYLVRASARPSGTEGNWTLPLPSAWGRGSWSLYCHHLWKLGPTENQVTETWATRGPLPCFLALER